MGRTEERPAWLDKPLTIENFRALRIAYVAEMRRDYKRLLAENARLEAERDAAIADLNLNGNCVTCKNALRNGGKCCGGCREFVGSDYRYEWRGAQPATGAEENPWSPNRYYEFRNTSTPPYSECYRTDDGGKTFTKVGKTQERSGGKP